MISVGLITIPDVLLHHDSISWSAAIGMIAFDAAPTNRSAIGIAAAFSVFVMIGLPTCLISDRRALRVDQTELVN